MAYKRITKSKDFLKYFSDKWKERYVPSRKTKPKQISLFDVINRLIKLMEAKKCKFDIKYLKNQRNYMIFKDLDTYMELNNLMIEDIKKVLPSKYL